MRKKWWKGIIYGGAAAILYSIPLLYAVGTGIKNPNPNLSYFRFLWADGLILLGVEINTWWMWALAMAFLFVTGILWNFYIDYGMTPARMIVYTESPVRFRIYTKKALWIQNIVYNFVWAVRSALNIVVMISQIDFTLMNLIADMVGSTWTAKVYIEDKTRRYVTQEEEELLLKQKKQPAEEVEDMFDPGFKPTETRIQSNFVSSNTPIKYNTSFK